MAERWRGRVALVTGASAGIGESVARALVERGMKVVGCARNIDKIQKLSEELKREGHEGFLTAVQCDVAQEEQVVSMFEKIRQDPSLGCVHVCVNNAGLAHDAPLLSGEPSQWRHMFDVNVLGLLMCSKESFKLMKENNVDNGHIILVNSFLGSVVTSQAGLHCYSATKFAVTAIREGLRHELRELKSHIRISQVCPGTVETEFLDRYIGGDVSKQVFSSMKCMQAEDIANTVLFILDSPPHVEINDVLVRPTEQVD